MHTPSLHYPDSIKLFFGTPKNLSFFCIDYWWLIYFSCPLTFLCPIFCAGLGSAKYIPPPFPVYTMTLDFIYASRIFPCTLVQCTYTVRGGGHKVREKKSNTFAELCLPTLLLLSTCPQGGGEVHVVRYESVWVDIAALITHCTKVSKAILQNWTSCHTSNVEFHGVGIINAKSNRLKIVFINLTY